MLTCTVSCQRYTLARQLGACSAASGLITGVCRNQHITDDNDSTLTAAADKIKDLNTSVT